MNTAFAFVAANAAKWVGIAGLFAGAFYHATVTKQYGDAYALLMAATAAMGFAGKLTHLQANQEDVKDGITNIRENPAMPGTPPAKRDEPPGRRGR